MMIELVVFYASAHDSQGKTNFSLVSILHYKSIIAAKIKIFKLIPLIYPPHQFITQCAIKANIFNPYHFKGMVCL